MSGDDPMLRGAQKTGDLMFPADAGMTPAELKSARHALGLSAERFANADEAVK